MWPMETVSDEPTVEPSDQRRFILSGQRVHSQFCQSSDVHDLVKSQYFVPVDSDHDASE